MQVIYEISRYPIIDISEPSRPNGLIRINPHFKHIFLVLCEWDLRFICYEWRGILYVQYMPKQFSCRILYIWLQ
jgi:hypothetical protein